MRLKLTHLTSTLKQSQEGVRIKFKLQLDGLWQAKVMPGLLWSLLGVTFDS